MSTYVELQKLLDGHKGEVCIFGAGIIAQHNAYPFLKGFGFKVAFYSDNNMEPGTVVNDGIKVKELEYLYQNKERILVFICVSDKYQKEILAQLQAHDVTNVCIIDSHYIYQVLESIDKADVSVKKKYELIYDDKKFLEDRFRRMNGYELNIEKPQTFNEKIQWLKLYDRNPEYSKLVDKFEFKKYIAENFGQEYVIPTLGIWNTVDEIKWDNLPEQFVLKCTHDCGSVIVCKDKSKFDLEYAKEKLEKALKCNYYWCSREWPYKNIKPRIIAEEYMEDLSGEIIDYKFLCYNGTCKYIFTCTERFTESGLKVTFFDCEWNKLPIKRHYPVSEQKIEKPKNLKKMIEIAEKLTRQIPFVRVDFYEINSRLYIGEFTFYPGGGMEEFDNYEDDVLLGRDIICGDWIR